MLNVGFTQADLDALHRLIDAAVRASGIEGARLAIPLVEKIEAAIRTAREAEKDNSNG
jgi:hypothetical protein